MRWTLLAIAAASIGCGGPKPVVGGPFPGDPANFTYDLEGTKVTLKNGAHEVKTGPGVDDVVATDLTGVRSDADFDGDDSTDAAVVVTRDDGPLKVHYLVVIRNPGGGALPAVAARLGKNVLVEKLGPHPKGGVAVRLLVRDEGVPESEPPTLTADQRWVVKDGALVKQK